MIKDGYKTKIMPAAVYLKSADGLSVDFSYCWINLVEAWYSLEQYIGW